MRISCAMMASSITPPAEDEGAEVDGVVEAGGVVISIWGRLSLSCALLHRMVAASIVINFVPYRPKWLENFMPVT